MGDLCSKFNRPNEREEYLSLQKLPDYLQNYQSIPQNFFNRFTLIASNDDDRAHFQRIFTQMASTKSFLPELLQINDRAIQRSIASLLGLAICDALGASTEFLPFKKAGHGIIKQGFGDVKMAIRTKVLQPRAGTVGIWTDDCSMSLCMATSLIYCKHEFVPKHIRYLFNLWWYNGLNNGGRQRSIGLGGNISISMKQFLKRPSDYCAVGDRFNNGNGSLMRLAPIPILYRKDKAKAQLYSGYSSLTTHNGEQAEECCKLLATILYSLYNRQKGLDPKTTLDEACKSFKTKCKSVYCLANSMQQTEEEYQNMCNKYGKRFSKFNKSVADRNWKWKQPSFTYCKSRFEDKPGYVGSYCMDGLAMALHTIWYTNNFKQMALMNANMGGDCDSVGAIAGQIAGAMYGLDTDMMRLYSEMQDFKKGRYEVFLHGYKLATAQ